MQSIGTTGRWWLDRGWRRAHEQAWIGRRASERSAAVIGETHQDVVVARPRSLYTRVSVLTRCGIEARWYAAVGLVRVQIDIGTEGHHHLLWIGWVHRAGQIVRCAEDRVRRRSLSGMQARPKSCPP